MGRGTLYNGERSIVLWGEEHCIMGRGTLYYGERNIALLGEEHCIMWRGALYYGERSIVLWGDERQTIVTFVDVLHWLSGHTPCVKSIVYDERTERQSFCVVVLPWSEHAFSDRVHRVLVSSSCDAQSDMTFSND